MVVLYVGELTMDTYEISRIVKECGFEPPYPGESIASAHVKIYAALHSLREGCMELAGLVSVSVLLTSSNPFLRQLGEELYTQSLEVDQHKISEQNKE
jgi:hypothetical protein